MAFLVAVRVRVTDLEGLAVCVAVLVGVGDRLGDLLCVAVLEGERVGVAVCSIMMVGSVEA